MNDLLPELKQQPDALRELAAYYASDAGKWLLKSDPPAGLIIFAGMGASYHAALVAAAHATAQGLPALAIESTDLINYQSPGLLRGGHTLVYISQSGLSGEVSGLLMRNKGRARVIAVTNRPGSPLAQGADTCLRIMADQRLRLASKNYLNTLAVLWLLIRCWTGQSDYIALLTDALLYVAEQADGLLDRADATAAELLATFGKCGPLVFLGHGPHAATARQSALMLSEWARAAALYASIGAFRHGFVETVRQGMGALFFAPPGRTDDSAMALARKLPDFGVTVRHVAYGQLLKLDEPEPALDLDEFLAPLLDVIPMQIFTGALAQARGITPDFRYIDQTRAL